MKFNKVVFLGAVACFSVAASASSLISSEKPVKKVEKLKYTSSDFGAYKVERNLKLIPQSVASDQHIVSLKGSMAVVDVEHPADLVTKGTLVRNIFTNNLTSLSGNITVLLADGVVAKDVAENTGLRLVSSFSGTKVAVFAVNENQDVLKASGLLKDSGMVKEAKIEVSETIYQAH